MIGVYQCVKDTIWKQITTRNWIWQACHKVFISVSKIQFESKSQLIDYGKIITWGVYQCVKDTIWKQITTEAMQLANAAGVFISVSKIQFESKSQRFGRWIQYDYWCLSVCQRYNLKANHNGRKRFIGCSWGVYQCVKDTIWKQITTSRDFSLMRFVVFISVSKIQFESKSQLTVL